MCIIIHPIAWLPYDCLSTTVTKTRERALQYFYYHNNIPKYHVYLALSSIVDTTVGFRGHLRNILNIILYK